jgi:hypothetical protein
LFLAKCRADFSGLRFVAPTKPHTPKISDMELLSILCQLGRAATEATIRHSINERIGREVSAKWVKDRLAEAQAAGLAICGDGVGSVRLTALGVERLSGVSYPRGRE